MELDEVYADFQTEYYEQELARRLREEEMRTAKQAQDVEKRVANLLGLYKDYAKDMFENCRQERIGKTAPALRRKRSQKAKGVQPVPDQKPILLTPQLTAGESSGGSPSSSSGESWAHVPRLATAQSGLSQDQHHLSNLGLSLPGYPDPMSPSPLSPDRITGVMPPPNIVGRGAIHLPQGGQYVGGSPNLLAGQQHQRADSAVSFVDGLPSYHNHHTPAGFQYQPQAQPPPFRSNRSFHQPFEFAEQQHAMQTPHTSSTHHPMAYHQTPMMMQQLPDSLSDPSGLDPTLFAIDAAFASQHSLDDNGNVN